MCNKKSFIHSSYENFSDIRSTIMCIYMKNEKYLSMFNHSVSTPFDVIYGYYYTMYDFSFTCNVVSYTHIFYIYLIKRIDIHTHKCVLMMRNFETILSCKILFLVHA